MTRLQDIENVILNLYLSDFIDQSIQHKQWRSQPDNLVPLCKFKIIIIIHFFRN